MCFNLNTTHSQARHDWGGHGNWHRNNNNLQQYETVQIYLKYFSCIPLHQIFRLFIHAHTHTHTHKNGYNRTRKKDKSKNRQAGIWTVTFKVWEEKPPTHICWPVLINSWQWLFFFIYKIKKDYHHALSLLTPWTRGWLEKYPFRSHKFSRWLSLRSHHTSFSQLF